MIEKIRHGSEISSAKLNEIIEAVNTTNNEHQTIRNLGEDIKTTVKEVYNTLEKYSEQVGEHLDSIPEIRNLYADILLARDSVDWIDLAEDETDVSAFIAAALDGFATDQPAERLKVIRGTTNQITLNTPKVKDKQILIAYDEHSNKGIMYFDIGNRRIPVSASGDINITALVPELSFETLSNGQEVLKITNQDGSTQYSQDLRGPAGTPGVQGPKGEQGEKGETGERGLQGIQGTKGQDGATTLISIWYSNDATGFNRTDQYNNQKFMGIRTYLSTDDAGAVEARPIKWFRISGDTLYPIYDKDTGYLTFTTTKPKESSFYIKGKKGDQGPEGKAPTLVFSDGTDDIDIIPSIDTKGRYVYDTSLFKGPKGDQGDRGLQGIQGPKGDKPNIAFRAEHTDEDQPTITDTTPVGSEYDAVYTIKVPKGQDGLSAFEVQHLEDGTSEIYLTKNPTKVNPTIDARINLGNLKGEKGDKGDKGDTGPQGAPGATGAQGIQGIPGPKGDTGADGTSFRIYGRYASLALLQTAHPTGSVGEAYSVGTIEDNTIYLWSVDDSEWVDIGSLQGPKGDKGDTGAQGPEGRQGPKGDQGDTGPAGKDGNQGPAGKDGVKWITGKLVTQSGTVNLEAGYKVDDRYLNTDTGIFYRIATASGTTYTVLEEGSLKGPQGIQGIQGIKGDAGIGINKIEKTTSLNNVDTYTITYTDIDPNTGTYRTSEFTVTNGLNGKDGINGSDGSKIFEGTGTAGSTLGAVGDFYIDTNTGILYKKVNSSTWEHLVKLKGTDGINGKDGIRGPKINTLGGDTPPTDTTNFMLGDLVLLLGTSGLYEVQGTEEKKSWALIGNLKGLQGNKGDKGDVGPTGSYIKAQKLENAQQAVSLTMAQSVYYVLTNTNITAISLQLGTVAEGTVGEFICEFNINTGNGSPVISLPSGVSYANGWSQSDFISGYTYILYILNKTAYVSFKAL